MTFSVNAVNVAEGETLVFDEVRINEGNHYDPTTGIYTGPVPVADLTGCKGYPSLLSDHFVFIFMVIFEKKYAK